MKRIFAPGIGLVRLGICGLGLALALAPVARAQDAAAPVGRPAAVGMSPAEIEENYKVLKGHVQDLLDAQLAQDKKLQAMAREIADLRDQLNKPSGNYASQEDLKRLADSVQEIDRQRREDTKRILDEFARLGKSIGASAGSHTGGSRSTTSVKDKEADNVPAAANENGYTYQIKSGDTLSIIAQAYREQGIKVTSSDIEKANPGLNPNKLIVGKKIFIPATKTTVAKNGKE